MIDVETDYLIKGDKTLSQYTVALTPESPTVIASESCDPTNE